MSEFDDMGDIVQKYCECVDPAVNAKNNCCEACGMLFNFQGVYVDGSTVPGFHEEYNSPKALNERRRKEVGKTIDLELATFREQSTNPSFMAYLDGPKDSIFVTGEAIWGIYPAPVWPDPRPKWDSYFMTLAFIASQRSLDKHTKHGCILVGGDHSVLSTGLNGGPRGYPDHEIDLERPGKYAFFEHAERNAIANAARHGIALLGSTCYVTGWPCNDCYRIMWQAGIIRIVYAPISLEYKTTDHLALKAKGRGPTLTQFSEDQCNSVLHLLAQTVEYFSQKVTPVAP